MSNNISPAQLLTQALQQLNKADASSSLTRQGAQVIVQQLTGNQLVIAQPKQSRSIALPTSKLEGKLQAGQSYQAKVIQNGNESLLQFLSNTAKQTAVVLDNAKLAALLSQIAAQGTSQKGLIGTSQATSANSANASIELPAKVLQVAYSQVKLQLTLPNSSATKHINIQLPTSELNLKVGQLVTVQLKEQTNNQWQGVISKVNQTTQNVKGTPEQAQNQQTALSKAVNIPLNQEQSAIIKALASTTNLQQSSALGNAQLLNNSPIAKADIIALFRQSKAPTSAIKQIESTAQSQLLVSVKGKQITIDLPLVDKLSQAAPKPVAQLPLTADTIKQLSHFIKAQSQSPISSQDKTAQITAPPLGNQVNKASTTAPNVANVNQQPSQQLGQIATLLKQLPPDIQIQLTELVQRNIGQARSASEAPAVVLNQIQQLASQPRIKSDSGQHSLLQEIVDNIKQLIPNGKKQDQANIKNLLSSTTIPLHTIATQAAFVPASLEAITQNKSNSLVDSLVQILQASFVVNAAPQSTGQSAAQLNILSQLFQQLFKGKANTAASGPKGQQFSQLEQNSQLSKRLISLMATHQMNKLTSNELSMQGQDTLYYTLPSLFGNQFKDIELLIKRESEPDKSDEQNNNPGGIWHLTMKLSIGEQGEAMAKVKLTGENLDLNFYVEDNHLQRKINKFIPLLIERFTSLGLDVNQSSCHLGKIPEQLVERPYSLFQAKA